MTPQEEYTVLMFSAGHKHTLLFIAYAKHALVNIEMNAGQRLRFLELIHGCIDFTVTQEMVALIEPMSDTEMQMMHEARSLNSEADPAGMVSYRLLTRPDVFGHFLALNPSLLAAIMLHQKKFDGPPVTFTAESVPAFPTIPIPPSPPAWLTGADRPDRFVTRPAEQRFAVGAPIIPTAASTPLPDGSTMARMSNKIAVLLFLGMIGVAHADDLKPYTLTAADAAAANARRPDDWVPHRVTAGDVFAIDGYHLIHIPTVIPTKEGGEAAFVDLEFVQDNGAPR